MRKIREWWFGENTVRKRELAGLLGFLRLEDTQFVGNVRDLVYGLDSNGIVMLMVAYKNVIPTFQALERLSREDPEKLAGLKRNVGTMGGFLVHLCDEYDEISVACASGTKKISIAEASEQAEVSRRRICRFAQTALLMWADRLAEANPRCANALADAWIYLAEYIMSIKIALTHNILWSGDEKVWFRSADNPYSSVPDQTFSLKFCARTMPRSLRKHASVRHFLERHDLQHLQ